MPSYLTLPGITGDAVADRHEGSIEIDQWSLSCRQAGDAGGVARRQGRAEFSDVTISCGGSSASPQLLQACATGKAMPEAVLVRDQPDGAAGLTTTEVRLSDVRVTDYSCSDNGVDLRDDFHLRFGRITFTSRRLRADGSIGDPVSTTQDTGGPAPPRPATGPVWRHREVTPTR